MLRRVLTWLYEWKETLVMLRDPLCRETLLDPNRDTPPSPT